MQIKILFKYLIPFLWVLLLSLESCKVTQLPAPVDTISGGTLYRDQAPGDTSDIANVPWRSLFNDKQLVSLIDEGLRNNPDLQIAIARMKKAEATLRQSKNAFFPGLAIAPEVSYQKSGKAGAVKQYEITGSSSWEADIWGKLQNAKKASLSLYLKSEAYKRAVQTQLVADVANSYYTLMALDMQLIATEQAVKIRNSDVETIKVMKESDMVTGADLVQSQANLFSAMVSIPDIRQSIYETENSLSIMLGRNPGPVKRDSLSGQQFSDSLTLGLPARLLANRPDVQEAEFQLRYGQEMTKAAEKYFYPSLTINATGGFLTGDLSNMFNASSLFGKLVGGLTQPLFNQGLNRQRLIAARADEEEYLAAYRQVLLQSVGEVADAIHRYRTSSEKIALRTSQIKYLEKSVDFTMELLKYSSSTNYTDVLMAEMNLLSAQLEGINDKLQQLQSVVSLYRSLGGGWK